MCFGQEERIQIYPLEPDQYGNTAQMHNGALMISDINIGFTVVRTVVAERSGGFTGFEILAK